MTNPTWETVNIPTAASDSPFLKWGDLAGQQITAVVLDYTPDGGRGFDGEACPRIDLQLIQPGYNIADGQQVNMEPGDKVTWQGNTPARLANGLREANPAKGDLIQLTHKGTYKTPNGTGKQIEIQIARGAGAQYLTAPGEPANPFKAAPPF